MWLTLMVMTIDKRIAKGYKYSDPYVASSFLSKEYMVCSAAGQELD